MSAAPPPGEADLTAAPLVHTMLHLLDGHGEPEISLGDFVGAMGARGFGFGLIVFGVLAIALPVVGSVMGAPVMLFALQLAWGSQRPWMPQWLARRALSVAQARRALEWARPWLRRIEIFARPRAGWLTAGPFARLIGLICVLMGVIILLPGPLTNAPTGATCIIMGFALAERDGVLATIGFVAAIVATILGTSGFLLVGLAIWAWMKGYV